MVFRFKFFVTCYLLHITYYSLLNAIRNTRYSILFLKRCKMFDKEEMEKIKQSKKEWENNGLKKTLERFPERKDKFVTGSGKEIERLYTPVNLEESDHNKDLNFPGQYPYTRGVQPTMYRGRFWTMRQYAGFGTAEESNKRYKYLLDQGQTGLSVAFDLPTQIGYDSDHTMSLGEVGKVGVAIDSLKDMEMLFNGIPLDKVSTSMTINAPAPVLLAMYIAVAEKQGVAPDKLKGTIQNDILKEYIARGTYIFPPVPSMRLITNIFEFCFKEMPLWNTISISGYHIREAGSTAVQEVAFTLADAYYVETLTNEIEKQALEYIEKIDKIGGVTQAIEKGFIQQEIQNSAYQYQKDIEGNKRIVVGVNKFKIEEGSPKGLLKVNPEVGRRQVEDLKKLKGQRDDHKVKGNLKLLEKAAKTDANLMPLILDCVKSYATLGEICDALRSIFGEYKESVKL